MNTLPLTPKDAAEKLLVTAFLDNLLRGIHPVLREMSREARFTFIFSLCTNLSGPIPEAEWRELLERSAKPCGKSDCRCEMHSRPLFEALDDLRDDWREMCLKPEER